MTTLFKILGSEKRRDILKLLRNREMHITAIAKELGISVPVALKHVKQLESAGLVTRTKVGNAHLIKIRADRLNLLDSIWSLLYEPMILETKKGTTLLDLLRRMPEIGIKSTPQGCYINSVDGREGYFVYEINGKLSDEPIEQCKISGDADLEIKRLIPALDKKIKIKIK
jgi:DNA-binding transcriptional ArsR family regulator